MAKGIAPAVREKVYFDNLRAARIVAAEPERYPGAIQEWARMVIERGPKRPQEGAKG